MAGKVTVFNCFNEPVTNLSVAGYSAAATIAGWADGTVTGVPKYTPSSTTVPRAKYAGSSAVFAIGDNAVKVPWDSFTGSITVTVPSSVPGTGPISLDQDLMLYVGANQAFLTTQFGYVIGTFTVVGALGGVQVDTEAGGAEPLSVNAS
ncbi:MAG TPA: hypothetical protein VF665_08780 [Longimicrobium sp.]|jgi:hypothetical protein|uniref:hypothetical protein n=1 Tax=Longimicrobium sp. TaxID=2029185 RepID=UPI002ED9197E